MVKLPSYFFILLSSVLVAASVIPFAGLKKELDSFAPVAREPNYPLNLAKREASGRKARHVRPDYGAMGEKPRHERPDYGAMDEKPRHERPDYGAMNEKPRHERPDYGAMDEKPRHERPDYGAMDEKPRHERPDYGAMNEKRGITLPDNEQTKKSPDGEIPNPYVFSLSERSTREVSPGGWIKIQDSTRNFKESWAATAYVHVEPNGLRELHWHADEGTSNLGHLARFTDAVHFRMALRYFRERGGCCICRWFLLEDLRASSRRLCRIPKLLWPLCSYFPSLLESD